MRFCLPQRLSLIQCSPPVTCGAWQHPSACSTAVRPGCIRPCTRRPLGCGRCLSRCSWAQRRARSGGSLVTAAPLDAHLVSQHLPLDLVGASCCPLCSAAAVCTLGGHWGADVASAAALLTLSAARVEWRFGRCCGLQSASGWPNGSFQPRGVPHCLRCPLALCVQWPSGRSCFLGCCSRCSLRSCMHEKILPFW